MPSAEDGPGAGLLQRHPAATGRRRFAAAPVAAASALLLLPPPHRPIPMAAPTKAEMEAMFGREPEMLKSARVNAIETSIAGPFDGWVRGQRIRLANGQVWKVVDDTEDVVELNNPKVTVKRGLLGAIFLDIEARTVIRKCSACSNQNQISKRSRRCRWRPADREAVAVQYLAHEQQADALAAFLGGEEGREQLMRRHLAQQVAAVDHR
jgi:hypothetical protein